MKNVVKKIILMKNDKGLVDTIKTSLWLNNYLQKH